VHRHRRRRQHRRAVLGGTAAPRAFPSPRWRGKYTFMVVPCPTSL
jgi:hypothetical protein